MDSFIRATARREGKEKKKNTVLENSRKSLIFTTLRAKRATFTFWKQKFIKNAKMVNLANFSNIKLVVKQCYQTGQFYIGQKLEKMPRFK